MKTSILKIERDRLKAQAALDQRSRQNNPLNRPTPLLEIARMRLAMKGVCNHWTATYRRGPEGFLVFRNPSNPGVLPLP